MPLLWKKGKIAQLSGLISDLRSRRRRSSLLVQTGFPTSLADLVVKNRTRLKKPSPPSSKKKKKKTTTTAGDDCSPATEDSASSSCSEAPAVELSLRDGSTCEIVEEFSQSELSCSVSAELKGSVAVSRPRWYSVMAKAFFVVVLALGSKGIAVGITAFTFTLFFLEFMGERLSFCSSDSVGLLDLNQVDVIRLNESDLGSFDSKRRSALGRSDGDSIEVELTRNRAACGSDEIQAVESDLNSLEDKRRLEYPTKGAKSEVLTVAGDGVQIKVKKGRNRKLGGAIFKEKFLKKVIPKKFRRSKNGKVGGEEEKLDSRSEASEFRGGVGEEQGGREDDDDDEEKEAEDEEFHSSLSCDESILGNLEEMNLTRKTTFTKIEWNLGHLVPFVIVLLGLVGGRAFALLLTVACFLLVKSVEAVQRNFKKVYERRTLL